MKNRSPKSPSASPAVHESQRAVREHAGAADWQGVAESDDCFEQAPVGLQWVGPDGRILRANQTELEMLGYARDEYVGHHIAEFHADPQVTEDLLRRLQAGETLHDREVRLRARDGSIKYGLLSSQALFEDGELAYTRCFTRDITERKRAEEASRESEQRLRLILDSSLDAIVTADANGTITGWNGRAEQTFGWSAAEALGRSLHELLMPPRERPAHLAGLKRFLETGTGPILNRRIEVTALHRDSHEFPVELTVTSMRWRSSYLFNAYVRDITERKRAEEAAAAMAALVASSDDAIIGKDLNGIITSWNRGAAELYGYSAGEAIGHPVTMLMPPQQQHEEADFLARLKRGERIEHFDTQRLTRDGRLIDVSLTISPVIDREGRIIGASKIARDITERKRAERVLQESEARFRQLAENIREVFYISDLRAERMLYLSPAFDEIWGCAREQFYEASGSGHSFLRSVHALDRKRVAAAIQRQLDGEPTDTEYRIVRPDGSTRWIWDRAFPVRDGSGQVYRTTGIAEDVSERKRAEAVRTRRVRHATLRADVSSALATARTSTQQVLQSCAEAIVRHLTVSFARIWTVDAAGTTLELQASAGLYTHLDGPHSRVPVGQLKIGRIAATRRPLLTNDVANDPHIS
ncbi:MAG TPA: PAS domain S-box protein, partial [Phycisphaerae bacterium]